ncbi:MAG: trigger factor [Verrucomicrobia bacterium]|nr:trigger factor [Verrucomicrobiota bacterium]
MKISLENMGGCRRRVKGEIPSDHVRKTEGEVLLSFQKSARLPGFRPGHAPLEMVRRRYAADIQAELRTKLLREALTYAVETEKLHLVDDPAVEEANFEKDNKFKFILRVDLAPEFKLPAAKGLKIPNKSPQPVTDADISSALAELAEPMAHYHEISARPAQEGDFAVVDFEGTCGGKKIIELAPESGQVAEAKKLWLWLKPDTFLPGFASALFGMQIGETREVEVKFPTEFPQIPLRGQTGRYQVTLHGLKDRHVPEVDEAFAQENYKMPKAELENRIREDLTSSRKSAIHSEEARAVTMALLASTKMDVPEPLLEEERRRLVARLVDENQRRGVSNEELIKHKDEILKAAGQNAEENVKLSFLLRRIAEAEGIKVEEKEIIQEIAVLAAQSGQDPRLFAKRLHKSEVLPSLADTLLRKKTVDFLLQHAVRG